MIIDQIMETKEKLTIKNTPKEQLREWYFLMTLGRSLDDKAPNYLKQALGYLEKVGVHKDSMCYDIENKTPTEIDFLGAKIVDYAKESGVSTPFYITLTNLVKAIEDNYYK